MIGELSPGLVLIAGAALIPLFRANWRNAYLLILPLLSCAYVLTLPYGEFGQMSIFDYDLTTVRVDKLSFVFAVVFHLAAFLAALYALHESDCVQHSAGFIYAGSAIGAVFAGDLITLFIF